MVSIISHGLSREDSYSESIEDGVKEYVDIYIVVLSEPAISADFIMRDSRTPSRTNALKVHRDNRNARLSDLDADTDDGLKWTVKANYSTAIPEPQDDNPISRPPRIIMRSEQRTILSFTDHKGKPVLNKAGDLAAAREVDRARWIFDIEKNYPPNPYPSWLAKYQDAINKGAVKIRGRVWADGTLKVSDMTIGDEETEGEYTFIPVHIMIKFQRSGWDGRPLNQGFNEIYTFLEPDGEGNFTKKTIKRPIFIGKGEPTKEPIFLNKDGEAFRDGNGDIRTNLTPEEIIALKVEDYERLPFSVLPLK